MFTQILVSPSFFALELEVRTRQTDGRTDGLVGKSLQLVEV